nr:o-succinylbenzoate synthase [uncultured Carboxylicivirga sp.]
MLKADYTKHILEFNFPGGTSRGVLYEKPSWYIRIQDAEGNIGIGEISIIPNLSLDTEKVLDELVPEVCSNINTIVKDYQTRYLHLPALRFGIESALNNLEGNSAFLASDTSFTKGDDFIRINGLIWMGDIPNMNKQIEAKLEQGFTCLKMKIGALNFDDEMTVLQSIRKRFSKVVLEIRVDANGAFSVEDAIDKLERLAKLNLHSIEQPIKAGQWKQMGELCRQTPLPIALDEELIGVHEYKMRESLLDEIKPQYIILKPSLVGGFRSSKEWIQLAKNQNVGWWITSALEGNIGLSSIAQWTYTLQNNMPQGLGTGQVFKNNISSPLYLREDKLFYNPTKEWANPFE